MLSYQHIFHAGNLADVQKHSLLAWMLAYMGRKDKPYSYLESHSGRGLYALDDAAAQKTGEAEGGILRVADWFAPDHPYAIARARVVQNAGEMAYPGSPMIAAQILRANDRMHLAELHPQEYAALEYNMSPYAAKCYHADGFETMMAITPPTPRRGVLMIDPSYEIKTDYETIPSYIAKVHRKWNVGVIVLWYPILADGVHNGMLRALEAQKLPGAVRHEVRFAPIRVGHRMVGSGLFVVNAPYGFDKEAARLAKKFHALR